MTSYFNARMSLLAAFVLVLFAPALGLYGSHVPLLLLMVLALVWRFWRLEAASSLDAAHLAAEPGAKEKLAPLLSRLRIRGLLVAAGTFFASVFLFLFVAQMLGADPISTLIFSPWPLIEAMGTEDSLMSLQKLIIPATIVTSIGFPLLAIVSILLATLGGSGPIPKIALLRPFGERKMTQALKRVVAHRLGRVGFVYTLSDKHYKPNTLVAVVIGLWGFSEYILGPVFRPSIRYMNVLGPDMLGNLKAAMGRRVSPSWRTALSGNQALNIKSTDDVWQDVVDILLETTDFVVMDVSKVGAGSAWEIERLGALNYARRCIFIAQEGHEENAEAAVAGLAGGGVPPVLHVFGRDGRFRDEAAFQLELARMLLSPSSAADRAAAYSAAPA